MNGREIGDLTMLLHRYEPICGSKGRAGEECADPEACGCKPLDGDSYDDAMWANDEGGIWSPFNFSPDYEEEGGE